MNVQSQPHLVAWELTRACQLRCRHCRAQAITERNALELSTREITAVLDHMAASFHPLPILILTGGDPLERPDLSDIITAGRERGFPVALAPSATPRLTPHVIEDWARLGVNAISLSLDGATADVHDAFRGVRGTFARTMQLARSVTQAGVKLQINTSVCMQTVRDLTRIGDLVEDLDVSSWEVFFVVPTGRARTAAWPLGPQSQELALHWLVGYRRRAAFRVTAVAAPQLWRIVLQTRTGGGARGPAIRDAQGFAFIDHCGSVFPSGYLPLAAGNVRYDGFADIYRQSPLFLALRDPAQLKGKCHICPFRFVCGGSRARAYAISGDPLAQDPGCPYIPPSGDESPDCAPPNGGLAPTAPSR